MKKLILPILAAALFSFSAFALDDSTLDFYNLNGIYYYDPNGNNSCGPRLGSFDGVATAGLSDLNSAFIDTYHDIVASLGAEYGIPWETVMAQGIIESNSGTSRFARERNNFFGIGAFDSNPNNAHSFATPEDGWRGYFENIKNTVTYSTHGAFDHPGDPYGYLVAIKEAGYATDPNYIEKVSSVIKAIENRSKEKGWASSADVAGGNGPTTNYCNDPGNGDINSTAIALSWPDRSHGPDDPKPEYKEALSTTGIVGLGDSCSNIGKSCDAFVATVLRHSGADPEVECCTALKVYNYFASHPEKYDEIENIGNSSNLQPGDIRAKSSHVEIYVVLPDGSSRIASASHCDRTADHGIPYYADSSYRIFRRKS